MAFSDILRINEFKQENERLKTQANYLEEENSRLNIRVNYLEKQLSDFGFEDHEQAKRVLDSLNSEIAELNTTINTLHDEITNLANQANLIDKKLVTSTKKLNRTKEIYNSVEYAINNFLSYSPSLEQCKITSLESSDMEELTPSVMLKLHCMDMRDLRKAYNENNKRIDELLCKYDSRYTTKTNKAIYRLMVIALRAELQNILYNLKYEKLDKSIEDLKKITSKYLAIATEGNQIIAGTITKFVGEMEYLFINAIKIEYNYYVKKEQARQEQIAIREQMRQEAEERKALEEERKKIALEESKFESEIDKLKEKLLLAAEEERQLMEKRILELQNQLAEVVVKKENILNLQNGRAGNIYIISNLGSFGENVFKIGMTRRINPQDRVNELGDASVPFKFDVHSFIFSDDAVSLESELHNRLSDKRVNKVNLRKEFFYSSIDELELLVNEICPTAEFTKTMLAEEFRQSLSSDKVYSSDFTFFDVEDENE